ncbi:MFS transporter [Kitasatospora sp. NPDC004289]
MTTRGTAPGTAHSRWTALAVLCAGMLMIILDGTIVTVALPAIQADLGFTAEGLTWTVNAYLIAFGGLLLLAGRLGDLLGGRRIFVAGLVLFTAASLLAGLAGSQELLIAARFAQGIGGAMASAVSLGMIVTLFPEPGERGKAIGAFSFVGAAGASIGQVLGGVLTEAVGWHWIFFVNLPIGLAAVLLSLRVLAADGPARSLRGLDLPGAALVTVGLMLGVYAIVSIERSTTGALLLGAVSALLLAGFLLRQRYAAEPLLPLRLLRSRRVAAANLVQVLMVSALFGFQVLIALYLQNVLGYGAAATGFAMLPAAVVIGGVSLLLSAPLVARFGERTVLLGGLGLLVVAIGLLTRLPADASYVLHLLPTMLLAGGFGLAVAALTSLAMADAAPADAGVSSGLFNTTQQVGGALGVAVLVTLAGSRGQALAEAGRSQAEAMTAGFRAAFLLGTLLLLAATALAAVALRPAAGRVVATSRQEEKSLIRSGR